MKHDQENEVSTVGCRGNRPIDALDWNIFAMHLGGQSDVAEVQ